MSSPPASPEHGRSRQPWAETPGQAGKRTHAFSLFPRVSSTIHAKGQALSVSASAWFGNPQRQGKICTSIPKTGEQDRLHLLGPYRGPLLENQLRQARPNPTPTIACRANRDRLEKTGIYCRIWRDQVTYCRKPSLSYFCEVRPARIWSVNPEETVYDAIGPSWLRRESARRLLIISEGKLIGVLLRGAIYGPQDYSAGKDRRRATPAFGEIMTGRSPSTRGRRNIPSDECMRISSRIQPRSSPSGDGPATGCWE